MARLKDCHVRLYGDQFKTQVRSDGQYWAGFEPVHGNEQVFLDIQTLINLKESLPNELLEGWADRIAHRLKATIAERMEEDPAYYQRFSKLVQQAIDEWRAQRITEREYYLRLRHLDEQAAPTPKRACPPGSRYHTLLMFYLITGARRDQAAKPHLRWDKIDFDEGFTYLARQKQKERAFPITPELKASLLHIKEHPIEKQTNQ